MMLPRWLTFSILCAMCVAIPVGAHHSHGNYDLTTWTTMTGEVKGLPLPAPHSWFYLDEKEERGGGHPPGGAPEPRGPAGLTKVGVKREDVKPGDTIRV